MCVYTYIRICLCVWPGIFVTEQNVPIIAQHRDTVVTSRQVDTLSHTELTTAVVTEHQTTN